MTSPWRQVTVTALAALCAALAPGAPAPAHELGPPVSRALAWDCWVDASAEITRLRCIVDLDGTGAAEIDPALEHRVLHRIHDMIHGAAHADDLNRLLDRNWHVLREGDVWSIRVFQPPLDESWRTERPQTLVRSLLCPPRTPCSVHFKDRAPR